MAGATNNVGIINNDGWEPYDETAFNRVDQKDEKISTVGNVETAEEYVELNYHDLKNPIFQAQRTTLLDYSETYGKQLHRIRGDGNCGTTSFAAGLLYHISRSQQNRIALIDRAVELMMILQAAPTSELYRDIQICLELFEGLKRELNHPEYLQTLLENDNLMLSLSRVLRAIGHEGVKKDLRELGIATEEAVLDTFAEDIISKTPKQEIQIDGFRALSKLFGLRTHVIDLTGQLGHDKIAQFPDKDNCVADVVIFRSGSHDHFHYTVIIPDKDRQKAHGLNEVRAAPSALADIQTTQLSQRILPTLNKVEETALRKKEIKPVNPSNCSLITKIALPLIIGTWCLWGISSLMSSN